MNITGTPEASSSTPDFRLKGPGGQVYTLSEHRGRRSVVLVFFPLAFSPVCSHQLPLVQKELETLHRLGAEVVGISVDSHYANEAFARQLGLSFPLLSDFSREASRAFGVLDPDRQYSRRAVIVVDKQGRIVHRDESLPGSGIDGIPSIAAVVEALTRLP